MTHPLALLDLRFPEPLLLRRLLRISLLSCVLTRDQRHHAPGDRWRRMAMVRDGRDREEERVVYMQGTTTLMPSSRQRPGPRVFLQGEVNNAGPRTSTPREKDSTRKASGGEQSLVLDPSAASMRPANKRTHQTTCPRQPKRSTLNQTHPRARALTRAYNLTHVSLNVLSGSTPRGRPVFSDSVTCFTGPPAPSAPAAAAAAAGEGRRGRGGLGLRPVPSTDGWLSRFE